MTLPSWQKILLLINLLSLPVLNTETFSKHSRHCIIHSRWTIQPLGDTNIILHYNMGDCSFVFSLLLLFLFLVNSKRGLKLCLEMNKVPDLYCVQHIFSPEYRALPRLSPPPDSYVCYIRRGGTHPENLVHWHLEVTSQLTLYLWRETCGCWDILLNPGLSWKNKTVLNMNYATIKHFWAWSAIQCMEKALWDNV